MTNRIQHDIIDEYSRENLLSTDIAGWSSSVARRAHNPKVVSSNLAPATNYDKQIAWLLASGVISLSYIKVYINAAAALRLFSHRVPQQREYSFEYFHLYAHSQNAARSYLLVHLIFPSVRTAAIVIKLGVSFEKRKH